MKIVLCFALAIGRAREKGRVLRLPKWRAARGVEREIQLYMV